MLISSTWWKVQADCIINTAAVVSLRYPCSGLVMGKRYDADVNAGQLLVLWKVSQSINFCSLYRDGDDFSWSHPAEIYREFQTVAVWFKR